MVVGTDLIVNRDTHMGAGPRLANLGVIDLHLLDRFLKVGGMTPEVETIPELEATVFDEDSGDVEPIIIMTHRANFFFPWAVHKTSSDYSNAAINCMNSQT
jgi:hypothetical protein